ncbi:outer membrane protein assembly factor BamB family protein [Phytohabitans sp. LJ34]|uniref:outer membrane protein assembly factor BamB family protein n=1 Tax=Phytohabitans sp. LJ34 TaxID=3452217 RepID=UPI003F8CC434
MTLGRVVARQVGWMLLAVGAVLLVAGLFLPWDWAGTRRPPTAAVLALVGLGPVTSAAVILRYWWPGSRPHRGPGPPLAAAGAAALATVIAAGLLLRIDPERGIRIGGPEATLGCLGLLAGWLLVAAGRDGRLKWTLTALLAALVVLLLGPAAAPALSWYADGRFVRHDTSTALPDVVPAAPAAPTRTSWQARVPLVETYQDPAAPLVAGRYLVLTHAYGASAVDAVTGETRWSYTRSDGLTVVAAVVAGGGRTAAVLFDGYIGGLVVGLDTATGRQLWQRRDRGWGRATTMFGTDAAVLVNDRTARGGEAVTQALDPRGGVLRWTWRSGTGERHGCWAQTGTPASDVVAIVVLCDAREQDFVAALSTQDGHELWRWQPGGGGDRTPFPRSIRATGAGFWVATTTPATRDGAPAVDTARVLDPRTGTPSAEHPLPPGLPVFAGATAVYVGDSTTAVDLTTGRERWRRDVPDLAGRAPAAVTERDGAAYVLAAADGDAAAPGTRLLVLDTTTGTVRAQHPFDPPGCPATPRSTLSLAAAALVVASTDRSGDTTCLTALG